MASPGRTDRNVGKLNKIANEHRRNGVSEISDTLGMYYGTWQISAKFGIDCSPTIKGSGNILPAKTWV